MKIIVGLGNPGREYNNTRHNIGFMVIDRFLKKIDAPKLKEKYGGLYYEYIYNNEKIIFLKPQEYINLSGMVLKKFVDYYNISIDDILIINDDLDLEIGRFKLKPSGSSAGHNGLKNIESCLNTNEYKRLKIGISSNGSIEKKDYVLGKLSSEDLDEINKIVEISSDIIIDYLNMSFDELMNKYNRK